MGNPVAIQVQTMIREYTFDCFSNILSVRLGRAGHDFPEIGYRSLQVSGFVAYCCARINECSASRHWVLRI